ncbi:hypothetical protein UA08_04166 [Talaromyces atroroseus]|uniref:Protein kinase domain-containing protein n=1 Tax=Talaromyces atroroseus TaxID=1441469 RepID=A0A1Q5Q947_TALAT|nr:hypothetical protein UA08_04166 [Talaromyces atroroseus]OKL60635.1 hypothetical protein UA08_04166 [Talaromyces atroroseus]
MQQSLAHCPNLRVVNDTIPEHLLFVYEYLASDLLQFAVKDNLSDIARRRILRGALPGLAHLHANNIFTMLRKIIFQVDDQDAISEEIIARRMISHIADGPGLVGFVQTHLEEDSQQFRQLMLDVVQEFITAGNPRRPFSMWDNADEDFHEVVTRTTNLDPSRRITAEEAMEHPWFKNV